MTEFLTEEQIKRRAIVSEDVDLRGLVKRHRVADQTIFDMMFLMELISQGHHEAAHLFLNAFATAGAACKSCSLDADFHTAAHVIGSAMGEKRMAFSSAYRHVVDSVGDGVASHLIKYFNCVYEYPDDRSILKSVADFLKPGLDALSEHYGTQWRVDPRRVIKRQLPRVKQKGSSHI